MAKAKQPQSRPNYADWYTKEVTSSALNVSTKTVERLAKDGQIQRKKWKRPEGGPVIVVYHPADVERARKKLNPEAAPFVMPAETSLPVRASTLTAPAGPGRHPDASLAAQIVKAGQFIAETQSRPVPVPLTHVLFLTRLEAAQYSGLPLSVIIRLIAAAELRAVKTGRGWRVSRADLERVCGQAGIVERVAQKHPTEPTFEPEHRTVMLLTTGQN